MDFVKYISCITCVYLWDENNKLDDRSAKDEETGSEDILQLHLVFERESKDDTQNAEDGHVVDAHTDVLGIVKSWDSNLHNADQIILSSHCLQFAVVGTHI